MFRKHFTLLFELGMEAYRVVKKGARDEARTVPERVRQAFEMVQRGTFHKEAAIDAELIACSSTRSAISLRALRRRWHSVRKTAQPQ